MIEYKCQHVLDYTEVEIPLDGGGAKILQNHRYCQLYFESGCHACVST